MNTDLTGHKLENYSNQFSSEYPWFTLDQISGKILYLNPNINNEQVELNSLNLKDSSIQNLGELGRLAFEAFLEYDFFNGKIYFSDFNNKRIASFDLSTQIIQSIYSWPDMKQDSRFQLDPWNQLMFIPRSGGLDKFSLQNQTTEFISLPEPIQCFRIHPLLRKLTVKSSSINEFTYDGALIRQFNIQQVDGEENELYYDLSNNNLYSYSFKDFGAGLELWYIQKLDDSLFNRVAIYFSQFPFYHCMQFLYHQIPSAIIDPQNELLNLELWPNPSTGSFYINLPNGVDEISDIRVYNINGNMVPAKLLKCSDNLLKLQLSDNSAGVWLIKIRLSNNQTYVKKIIIQE
ncbi:MAG: T9SS type A sorting domain-containing protein [Saprospiraceae bacterium]|nr:T9SS type A sorting domain-containing protein [Saprospiraceae bacterium]